MTASFVATCARRLALVALAAGLQPVPGAAQHPPISGYQPEEEWLTLADFRHVTALATGDQSSFVGTAGGVEALPFLSLEPGGTVTAGDGLPVGVVSALAFDEREGRLWIGTPLGLARYDPFRGEVVQDPAGLGRLPVADLRLGVEPGGSAGAEAPSLFVLAGSDWYRLDPFSLSARPVGRSRVPPPPPAVEPSTLPFLGGGSVRGERSGRSQSFRVTAARPLAGGRILLGTWGGNAWIYDEARLAAEPVVYGLAGPGGGAMGWDGERLWFTNAPGHPASAVGLDPRIGDEVGIASASGELTGWRHDYPGLEAALPSARAHDVAFAEGRTFLATDGGLAVHDDESGAWIRVPALPETAGEALAVEPAADGVWLGTRRGLVALRWPRGESGDAARPSVAGRWLDDREVRALAADRRALYAGTDRGLWRLAPDTAGSWRLTAVTTLGREVRDLALLDREVVVAHERGVEILPLGEGESETLAVGEGALDDAPLSIAADRANVWIGTRGGVTRWDRLRRRWSRYGLADGLPDLPVLDVLLQDDQTVWFSTPGGVTRHRPRDVSAP